MKRKSVIVLTATLVFLLGSCDTVRFSSGTSSAVLSSPGTSVSSEPMSSSDTSSVNTASSSYDSHDPYADISDDVFYGSYQPASSESDAYYRTLHHLMSGSIEEQEQIPSYAANPPMSGSSYIRNSAAGYSDDSNAYLIVDASGNAVDTVYRAGAYVTLEEVAAYIYAFGDVPPNYTSSKDTGLPSTSPWGIYLRLNNSYFSDDTSRYEYEPVLPGAAGDTGNSEKLSYYETDIGTTGTYAYAGHYTPRVYNNGDTIVRGASRIVYAKTFADGTEISDPNDRFVFYTYDHYNDFQEYLNYEGGWGEWFGNMAGGGTLNNDTPLYKTAYPATERMPF